MELQAQFQMLMTLSMAINQTMITVSSDLSFSMGSVQSYQQVEMVETIGDEEKPIIKNGKPVTEPMVTLANGKEIFLNEKHMAVFRPAFNQKVEIDSHLRNISQAIFSGFKQMLQQAQLPAQTPQTGEQK